MASPTPVSSNLRPDGDRLWLTLMRSAEIGTTARGGLCRLSLSEEDGVMRRQFQVWCEAAGCTLKVDAIGNMVAIRPGTDPDAKTILIGSHLDTQVRGGRFDGILGVLAGLEVIRTLNDNGIQTRHPIAAVNWTNEEGARFEPPMIGSAIFTGSRTIDFAHARTDRDGITVSSALDGIGFKGRDTIIPNQFDSLFELHIEQGPKLDTERLQVGVVTGAFAVRAFVLEVKGEIGHSGTTPMPRRHNAIVGAAGVVNAIERIGQDAHPEEGKSTTMRFTAEPNLLGILPDRVEMTCDLRHPAEVGVEAMFARFKAEIPALEATSRCSIEIREVFPYGGMQFDPGCVGLVREAIKALGYSHAEMLTHAGHDAMHVATRLPTAMIFTPCEGGLSHNEAENVTQAEIEPGLNVLFHAVLTRAQLDLAAHTGHPVRATGTDYTAGTLAAPPG